MGMGGFTIVILGLIILAASLFTALGSKITIGVGALLWIVLGALVMGAAWIIILMVSVVDGRHKKWKN